MSEHEHRSQFMGRQRRVIQLRSEKAFESYGDEMEIIDHLLVLKIHIDSFLKDLQDKPSWRQYNEKKKHWAKKIIAKKQTPVYIKTNN